MVGIMVLEVLSPLSVKENSHIEYCGFNEIEPAKTVCIIIGDTQRTSRWEFWREKNFSKTQLLLAEIARREPAFVINLGDLTTRGSSRTHWKYFDRYHGPIFERQRIEDYRVHASALK